MRSWIIIHASSRRTGRFVPVLESGGTLFRVKDENYYAVTGTKGHKWIGS